MKKKISLFSIAILLFVIFMISALFFDFNKKDKGDKVKITVADTTITSRTYMS